MIIEYTPTEEDIAKGYAYNWQHSSKMRGQIYRYAVTLGAFVLVLSYIGSGERLTFLGFVLAIATGVLFVFVHPYITKKLTKTQPRTLSLNETGLETKVGSQEGKIPWSAIDNIAATEAYIFITGKNAQVLALPRRAFPDEAQFKKFAKTAKKYHSDNLSLSVKS